MKRRHFIRTGAVVSAGLGSGMMACSGGQARPINKREAVLSLINDNKPQEYIPAGFFTHFDKKYHTGQAAIDKHLAYFRQTGLDFVKIQYEKEFPKIPEIKKPADWANMPLYKKDFFEEQLAVIEGIVKSAKSEAPVIATLYAPFAMAGTTTTYETVTRHLEEDPEQVVKGLEIITESLMNYAKECIKLGVDGFLQSTQGGEGGRYTDYRLFTEYVKPFDMAIGKEIEEHCSCNILHICDWAGDYDDYSAFVDYPGHIVNSSLHLRNHQQITAKEMYSLFNRPFMGGMDKRGILTSGSEAEIEAEVNQVLSEAPEKFILAASCTVPGDTDWERIKTAVDTAHQYKRG
ncbi:MAG: uroporphyrinogen decarboxylase family protein [Bacteroidota bacterium]